MNKGVFFSILFFIFLSTIVFAQNEKHNVTIYLFYGEECPHCAKARPFIDKLEQVYPELTVKRYEVWHDKENAKFFSKLSDVCNNPLPGIVPAVFIDEQVIVGYDSDESKGKEYEDAIKMCIEKSCIDPAIKLNQTTICKPPKDLEQKTIRVPILGEVDPKKLSLPIFAMVLGLLDGFNPCSMWVLLFLLALLAYTGSRKKMLFVGGLFILVSAAGYFLFMTAWLNFFLYIGFFSWMRILVGLGAIAAGLINMKELFFFRKGLSLSIPDKHKKKLIERMHFIIHEAAIPSVIVGIATLALTVNFVEFLCTAGFPAIFTKVLAMNHLNPFQYYFYMVVYIIMYELDDIVVLGIALIFFNRKTLTEKQGKWMKFIAGLMMLVLGLLLIIKPDLLMFG